MPPVLDPVRLPYLLVFGGVTLACFGLASVLARRTAAAGERELSTLFIAIGCWNACSVGILLVPQEFVVRVLFAGSLLLAIVVSVVWLRFAQVYCDRDPLPFPGSKYLVTGVLLAALVLPITNQLHGLVWTDIVVQYRYDIPVFLAERGPAHHLLTGASYLFTFAGIRCLAIRFWGARITRPAILAVLIGFSISISANVLPVVSDLLIEYPPAVTAGGGAFGAFGVLVAIRSDLSGTISIARRAVFDTLADPALVVDTDGCVLAANDAFIEIFKNPTIGESLTVTHPELFRQLDINAVGRQTVHVDGDDGESTYYSVIASPVGVDGTRGRSLVFRDISDLRSATRRLERQNSHLDELAYSAAHNLRNPLGVIDGYAGMIRTELEAIDDPAFDAERVEGYIDKVTSNSQRMEEIVTDLLRVTHASKTADNREWLALSEMATAARDAVNGVENLTITVDPDSEIRSNPEQFEMLLATLVRASRDRAASDEPVQIRLSARDDGFVFEDDALPIDEQDADVFLSYGYASKYPGTGLGLAVARMLATSHEWEIELEGSDDGLRVVVTGVNVQTSADATAGE
ncbi:MAG: histidine kinase N-terminal 7TM domain-containing protein [Halobacteriales archaeon]|nr:histidine kinase N-terminal 7TM domain-containing protein [Halobacteriales archaeon]